jgi:hypothetical protein
MELVCGLVAPGTLENVPVMAGADGRRIFSG